MPKIKKKGTAGQAKNFITRSQAVRKLQVSLPDFRRLCIFKGIYPREPRNKKKASKSSTPSTTFYYTKDIQYLLHEPLLAKFRDHKALAKKIGRALGRNEVSDAQRMERNLTPRLTLDHVIKERYPTFVDALRDLDDALSMLFLFANLPQSSTVPPKTIALCQRLCLEFEHYLIRTHSLRKSFLSIKGIYYQATIQGQDILWLVPYKFVQRVTEGDIDFRIMGTFVEFYTTLLGFVNYRLYTGVGLVYPPKFSTKSEEQGGELGAFTLEGKGIGQQGAEQDSSNGEQQQITSSAAQAEADKLSSLPTTDDAPPSSYATAPETTSTALDTESTTNVDDAMSAALESFPQSIDPNADALLQPAISSDTAGALFQQFTFYLGRETPRHSLEFLLRSFGCKRIGWDAISGDGAFTSDETDRRITHQIVDRPNLPASTIVESPEDVDESAPEGKIRAGERVPGRIHIQPQWVWDCVNAGQLLRTDLYAPGAVLPPHLSPWVKPKKSEYDPTKPLPEQELEGEAEVAEMDDDEVAKAVEEEGDDVDVSDGSEGEEVAGVRGDSEARELEDELISKGGKEVVSGDGMDIELAESDDEEEDEAEGADKDDDFTGFEESDAEAEDDDAMAAQQHQRELEAEARGVAMQSSSPAANRVDAGSTPGKALASDVQKRAAQRKKKQKEEEEQIERQKMMMPKRKRKLFEKMQYSNKKKDEEAVKLRDKRRKIEKSMASK